MTRTVQFLFDVGSPNAYLCHKVLPEIQQRTGAVVEYVPILLGGLFKLSNNRSPMESNAQIPNKRGLRDARDEALRRRSRSERVPLQPALSGEHAADHARRRRRRAHGLSRGLRRRDVLGDVGAGNEDGRRKPRCRVLAEAHLDAAGLLERSVTPEVKEQLLANTRSAFERGAFGSPTFFVGDEMYFGKDRLRDVEAALLARPAA